MYIFPCQMETFSLFVVIYLTNILEQEKCHVFSIVLNLSGLILVCLIP